MMIQQLAHNVFIEIEEIIFQNTVIEKELQYGNIRELLGSYYHEKRSVIMVGL